MSELRPYPSNARAALRAAARLRAAYEDERQQVFLQTRDLSETGVFLWASDPPPVGARARLLLQLPGQPAFVRLQGTVARREVTTTSASGFALCFEQSALDEGTRECLRDFVRQQIPHRQ